MDGSIPGLQKGIILEARLKPNILGALFGDTAMPTRMIVSNPLDAEIRVLKLNFVMKTDEASPRDLGRMDLDMADDPIVLAPRAASLTRQVIANVPLSGAAIQALFAGLISIPNDPPCFAACCEPSLTTLLWPLQARFRFALLAP